MGGEMELKHAPAQSLENTVELKTPAEIAKVIRCTPQHINSLHRKGIIPAAINFGRIVRFDRRAVIAALAAASQKGGPTA